VGEKLSLAGGFEEITFVDDIETFWSFNLPALTRSHDCRANGKKDEYIETLDLKTAPAQAQ
jgi:hypothetical protein